MMQTKSHPSGMLVTHLSTSDKAGGAAIAAWRLHQGLKSIGMESRVVSRFRNYPSLDVSYVHADVFRAADLFNQNQVRRAQPPDATYFTVAPTTVPLMDHPWIADADVVHLHWVARFLSPEDIELLCLAGKTVFWTLHDQWPYTGGCHYIGGDRRLEEDWNGSAQIGPDMHSLVRLEWLRKKRIFSKYPIHVVAPSHWMAREAAASGVFPAERIHVIPYGFDLSIFTSEATDVAEANQDMRVTLVFGCQNLGELRKGFKELREALLLCMEDPRFAAEVVSGGIQLQTFGKQLEKEVELPVPVTHLGVLAGDESVASVLRSSSALVCPTLDDNLPNVVVETLACGRPVLGFSTGGVPDMVTHDRNGLLAPRGDVAGLARHLIEFCLDGPLRHRLREGAEATDLTVWALETQARRMMDLYQAVGVSMKTRSNRVIPDAAPLVKLNGNILPHFATQIGLGLVEECQSLDATAKEKALSLDRRIKHDDHRLAQLRLELDEQISIHNVAARKLAYAEEELKKTREELEQSRTRVESLEQQLWEKRNTMLSRIRRVILRKS